MKHYILIEVREPEEPLPGGLTHAGFLRKFINKFAAEHGISMANNLIREDRPYTFSGHPQPYAETQAIMEKIMRKPGYK